MPCQGKGFKVVHLFRVHETLVHLLSTFIGGSIFVELGKMLIRFKLESSNFGVVITAIYYTCIMHH